MFGGKNDGSFSVMSHFCDFPLSSGLFLITLRQLSYKNWYNDPIFLKVPYKQLLVCCTAWKFEVKFDGSLFFTEKPGLPLR